MEDKISISEVLYKGQEDIKDTLKSIDGKLDNHTDRITKVEGKVENIITENKRLEDEVKGLRKWMGWIKVGAGVGAGSGTLGTVGHFLGVNQPVVQAIYEFGTKFFT